MIKVAILCSGDISHRKGLLNAVHERVVHLQKHNDLSVDVYAFSQKYPPYLSFLKGGKIERHTNHEVKSDGIVYNIRPFTKGLVDYLLQNILGLTPPLQTKIIHQFEKELAKYDILDIHTMDAHYLAIYMKRKYGIPYIVNWHGSDMHTYPQKNRYYRRRTISTLRNADCNIFVSKALKKIAMDLECSFKSRILYNGTSELMIRYGNLERNAIRKKYNPNGYKVVAFAGNLQKVKNTELFADIFSNIQKQYKHNISFWIIGDGPMRKQLIADFDKKHIKCIFWGNQKTTSMPDFLNCIDVLMLPSKNEGTPLIIMEAIKCGAKVVASDVGGIAECIGKDNVVQLGCNFVNEIVKRIIFLLENNVSQTFPADYDWETTSNKEYEIIKSLTCKA